MHRRFLLVLPLLAACSARVAAPPPPDVRDALMAADRAFAAETAARGLDGWMSVYARDAVRLRMGQTAVQGLAAVRTFDAPIFADPTVRLVWWPTDAGAFEDGRHGFSTGRSALVQVGGARDTVWRGSYVTLWRRARAGGWEVILDTGASDPPR